MPIQFNKQAFTLQEKVDKAIQLTYQIHNIGDSEFLRNFIIELMDKAYTKIQLGGTLDELKRMQE